MESASLRYGPAIDSNQPFSLSHSFQRHLRAKNLSDGDEEEIEGNRWRA
jgi:hypothetical protein